MVDIAGLPVATTTLTASDFTFRSAASAGQGWALASPPTSITIRRGSGVNGSDRVTLIWPDQAIANRYLEVTVKANANTGLNEASTFIVGNLIADSNGDRRVDVTDLGVLSSNFNGNPRTPAQGDFSGDRKVDVTDLGLLSTNFNRTLGTPPAFLRASATGTAQVRPPAAAFRTLSISSRPAAAPARLVKELLQ
jgi:hypothetical protein